MEWVALPPREQSDQVLARWPPTGTPRWPRAPPPPRAGGPQESPWVAVLRKHTVGALGTPASGTPGSGRRVSRAPSAGRRGTRPGSSPSLRGVGRFKSRAPAQFFSLWRPGEWGSPAARRQSIFLSTVEALESSQFPASPSLAPMYQLFFPFARDAFRIHKPVWAPLPPPHCAQERTPLWPPRSCLSPSGRLSHILSYVSSTTFLLIP